ncbi:MAG TPA: glycosyltransferase [Rhabdochlamydiaceae bacterium]|nr:glycosyltransferase [Rhabdochlamydiaceae bacterium]
MKFSRFVFFLFLMVSGFLFAEKAGEDEFNTLMGKETEYWDFIKKEEDVVALEKFRALYVKNKGRLFQTTGDFKIPKVIHFIWIGPRPFPPLSVENIRTWIAKNPDWKVKFWTDRDRPAPCNGMEVHKVDDFPFLFLKRFFEESQNYGEKSDVLRFEILFQEGGVYVDHDANCLRSFDNLHRGVDFYCGLEVPHPPLVGLGVTTGIGVVGSRPGHPIIKKVIDLISKEWQKIGKKYRGKDGYSRTQLVMERTYLMLTHALKKKCVDQAGNVDIVLPAAYFFAKKGIPPLYSKHFFANTWADDEEKNREFEKNARRAMEKIKQKNLTIRRIGKTVLSLNIIAFVAIFFYLVRKKKQQNEIT